MRLVGLVLTALALVAIMVLPLDIALGQGAANATRVLPDTVQRGETFNVALTFTAPANQFSSISLRDTAPDGWNATVNVAWCTPNADAVKAEGARASFTWNGPYPNGANFTVMHKVTVPCDASLGDHSFNVSEYENFLSYYIGEIGVIRENITGDSVVEVIPPAILTSPVSISFYAAFGKGNPQDQALELWSSTPCLLNWSLSDDASWLSENRTSGNCTNVHSSVAVSVNTSGMPAGDYSANITIEAPEARNSGQIVPVGLHIRETGTLQGQVTFEGRDDAPNDKWIEPFVVKLFQPGELSHAVWTGVATTNNTGVFTITDVVASTYDIAIKNATCLSKVVTNVTVVFNETKVVDFGTTREGDANNDDYIDASDYSAVSAAWLSWPGQPNWNAAADFSRDNYIDASDYGPLSINWLKWGDLFGV